MNEEIYKQSSEYFLFCSKRFRELKKEGKLNRQQINKIEKKLRMMSYLLLLTTPKNKNNLEIIRQRLIFCIRDFNNFNLHR